MGAIVDQLVLGRFSAVLGGSRLFLAVLGPLAVKNVSQKSIKMRPGGGKSGVPIEENEVLGALGGLWGARSQLTPPKP